MGSPEQQNATNGVVTAAAQPETSAAQFVAKFTAHYRKCVKLAKLFAGDDPQLKHSAALSQLCRASQEMLEQAKEARAMTEIYLALDEEHRDVVRPIITARFKDISRLARTSWQRFRDSIGIARATKPEIADAQRHFEPHAAQFQGALQAFISLSEKTVGGASHG